MGDSDIQSVRIRRAGFGMEIRYELPCAVCSGVLTHLSLDGFAVRAAGIPPVGASLVLVLESSHLRLPAVVQWTKPGGFGARLDLLGAHQTHALARFIDAQQEADGAGESRSA
jgi:hypothetical protein